MSQNWNRREFLQKAATGSASFSVIAAASFAARDKGRDEPVHKTVVKQVKDFSVKNKDSKSKVVIAHGEPDAAVKNALNAIGGISNFISKGDRVVLKPNIGWDRTPIQAANTNPLVVKTVVELCLNAGAEKVIVTDNSCNDAPRCFTRSGIWKLAKEAGAEVILPAQHRFSTFDIGGAVLGEMPVLSPAVECDKFINMPVAKHHGLSKFTGAMKNLYGILGGRRNRLHQKVNDSIADLADFIRPTLTIMDATRILFQNGPQGGNIADTKQINKIIISTDQVAVDAISCGLIGLDPKDIPYIIKAQNRGLGNADLSKIDIIEV